MKNLERAIQAIEQGLRTVNIIKGRPQESLSLPEHMTFYKVPGFSIALVDHEGIVWNKTYGVQEAGIGLPVSAETLFQAASISKTVSAMVALNLVEAGWLDLDADVNDVLRNWLVPENEHTQGQKVTLRGMREHSAGLTLPSFWGCPAGAQLPDLKQILNGEPPANSEPVRVIQPPGTAFSYSSGGYVLVHS